MKSFSSIITSIAFAGLFLFSSCELEQELEVCDYTLQLEYWYAENAGANDLHLYVRWIDEYIFDDKGILYMINRIDTKTCGKRMVSELTLPAGEYTVVSWANIEDASRVTGALAGETSLYDMQVRLEREGNLHKRSEDLYSGFRTVTVPETGVSRARMVMTHSFLTLDVTVRWKSRTPANTGDFYMTLENTHDRYAFLPHYTVSGNWINPFDYNEESYAIKDLSHRYYLVNREDQALKASHREEVKMDITRTINGRFQTYRIRNDSHPEFCLYGGGKALMKKIDLHKYFTNMSIELDMNLKQIFYIVVEINGDQVTVMPLTFTDWINGGEIGGRVS